jgi:hypothetical protein
LAVNGCREAHHLQEQRAAQLKRLMQKDMLIKAAACSFTFGRLTYPQVNQKLAASKHLHARMNA